MSSPSTAASSSRPPPTLPPRQPSSSSLSPADDEVPPPSYDSIAHSMTGKPWASDDDPRTSSTQSLVPSEPDAADARRTLLLVYIHGFMGNETSFRSFPAHVHNLLTVLLAASHTVHTKIYPRYRSKRNISFARDDFSRWLEPHEGDSTDVVLLGHSMGGLLSAEVVLMPDSAPAGRPLKHRIIGTVNFDVPFLGMHPGVVKSGLASIFTSADEPGDKWGDVQPRQPGDGDPAGPTQRADTLWKPEQQDPNYNPTFQNDVVLPVRKGWKNAWHFMNKHSDHLFRETKRLVTSHMEFGGAMANYGELRARYGRIRALEEESEDVRKSIVQGNTTPPRVRFVNYYTASTGRPKRPKSPSTPASPGGNASQTILAPPDVPSSLQAERGVSSHAKNERAPSPSISLEDHSDGSVVKKAPEMPPSPDQDWQDAAKSMTIQDSEPSRTNSNNDVLSPTASLATTASLPPVPDLPEAPHALDVSFIQDPATRKLVEKEHARAVKAYEKAAWDREKALRARQKLEEKQRRKADRDAEKATKDAEKAARAAEKAAMKAKAEQPEAQLTHAQREELRLEGERRRMEAEGRRLRGEPDPEPEREAHEPATSMPSPDDPAASIPSASPSPSRAASPPLSVPPQRQQQEDAETAAQPADDPAKDRKFCTLPPKDSAGAVDPAWVRVFMAGVDEVGAHCGLFFVDERYERLVGDVAGRVEGWVREVGDARVARGEGGVAGNEKW